jgi:hypothetical protein
MGLTFGLNSKFLRQSLTRSFQSGDLTRLLGRPQDPLLVDAFGTWFIILRPASYYFWMVGT